MDYDLGHSDHETCRLEPLENPFRAESVTHVSGMDPDWLTGDAV